MIVSVSQRASAEDLREWCINSYPSRIDWCNSQYPDRTASAATPSVPASQSEPEPKLARTEEPSEPDIPVRRVDSNHLADRTLARRYKVGDRLRITNGMGCFRFSENEYRCVRQVLDKAAVVTAPTISGVPDGYMDRHCPTFIRGFRNRECGFDLVFTITARGIDHMETTQFYGADHIELKPSTKR